MKILLVLILLLSSSFAVADEEHSFWSNVDKFLGKIADVLSEITYPPIRCRAYVYYTHKGGMAHVWGRITKLKVITNYL
jgi:hypothetical protein